MTYDESKKIEEMHSSALATAEFLYFDGLGSMRCHAVGRGSMRACHTCPVAVECATAIYHRFDLPDTWKEEG